MSIVQRMTARARHHHSERLGQCLSRLDGVAAEVPGCLQLRIFPLAHDPQIWQVEGRWRSTASWEAFLASEALRQVMAEAISEGLFSSLECGAQPLRQVA